MRLLLIQPPIEDFYSTEMRLQPIGLAYLKAILKKTFPEIEVIVKDMHHGWGRKTIAWPDELSYLKEFYSIHDLSPFSTFHHYFRFGADLKQALHEVERLNPDLVGISLLFTAYAPQALELAMAIKNRLKLPVLLGGSHVSSIPQQLLSLPFVDFVIVGEGERPMVEFVDQWLGQKQFKKVANLGFKDQAGRLILNEMKENYPLDDLPFPDFSDLNLDSYRFAQKRLSFLISSRSCPYQCAFCSVHQTFGRNYRLRSVENILQEIQVRREQGIQIIDFEDDNLTVNLKRFTKLCQALVEAFPSSKMTFMAMNGLSYFNLPADTLELMKQVGFETLNLSLVSLNEQVLKPLKRPYNLERFEKIVKRAFDLKMSVIAYQILGLPNESIESMIDTLAYLTGLPVRIGVSPFYVTPNMPIAQRLKLNEHDSWVYGRLTSLGATNNPILRRAIFTLFIIARVVNFLKQLNIESSSVTLAEILNESNHWQGRVQSGLEILARLIKQQKFFAFDGQAFKELKGFDNQILKKFLQKTKHITTLNGRTIVLKKKF